jgi:DNA-binding MarR family transcriptional regulator
MKRHQERNLEILTAIGEGRPLTQRALAQRLGVALGLTNLYLKRLAKKGFIKITEFPRKPHARKRLRYIVTPKGLLEKSRLTYDYMSYSLGIYRRTRETLRDTLSHLPGNGTKRVVLYGVGEAAELAYVTLKELGLEPIGVFAREAGGDFLGFPVRSVAEIVDESLDGIIVATFDRPEPYVADLTSLGIPRRKLLTLRRPLPADASVQS